MLRYLPVRRVHARQVLDSRGNPTVEVEVTVGEGVIGDKWIYGVRGNRPFGELPPESSRQWSFVTEKKAATPDLVSAKQWRM